MDAAESHNDFELHDISQSARTSRPDLTSTFQEEGNSDRVGQSLPPCDGGKVAWRLLWTMFVFEALLWGTVFFSGSSQYKKLITLNTRRFPTIIRCLPELLLAAP